MNTRETGAIEKRYLHGLVAFRANGTKGDREVVGTGVKFGVLSDDLGGFKEVFEPFAFAESLRNDDPRVVWQHDGAFVFGRVRSGTAKIWEDDEGLQYSANPPDATWAKDAIVSIKRGDVDQNSFSFIALDERFEVQDGENVRIVSRAFLREVGPQTFPANPDTTVAVRAFERARRLGTIATPRKYTKSGSYPEILRLRRDLDQRRPELASQTSSYSQTLQLRRDLEQRRQELHQLCLDTPIPDPRPTICARELRRLLHNGCTARRIKGIAIHEAGHAVLMVLEGIPIVRAYLAADGGGSVTPRSACPAVVFMAGQAAVEIARLEDAMPKWANDGDTRYAIEQLGSFYHTNRMRDRARSMLGREWQAVYALANALLKGGELDGAEAETIVLDNLSYTAKNRIRRAA